MRTKRAFPRIPRPSDGIRSDSADPRRACPPNLPYEGHFFRRQIVMSGDTILRASETEDETMAASRATYVQVREVFGAEANTAEAQAADRRLYVRVSDQDLAGVFSGQRASAALSLLAFARRRLPAVAKVRVFNPGAA